MQVSEIMRRIVHTIRSGETLEEAAQQIAAEHIGLLPVVEQAPVEETHLGNDVIAHLGFLPVVEEDVLVGVITARDMVVRALARGKDAKTTPVSEIMTRQFACCYEDDDVSDALDTMEHNRVRRLFVLNRRRQVIGIVSRHDIWAARSAAAGPDASGS